MRRVLVNAQNLTVAVGGLTHRGDGMDVIDRFAGGLSFVVSGLAASGGMIEMPVETKVSRAEHAREEAEPARGPS